MFYNSNCQSNIYPLNVSIGKDVRTLLRLTYPNMRIYNNGQNQCKLPLRAVFAMTFIESMLDPNTPLEEKFRNAEAVENRDDFIKNHQFKGLNRLIDSLRLNRDAYQIVDTSTDTNTRLLTIDANNLKKFGVYYVICENHNMDGFYIFDAYSNDKLSLQSTFTISLIQ